MKKYDVVAVFAFGLPPELESNKLLIKRAAYLGSIYNILVIAEGALPESETYQDNIFYLTPEENYTTLRFVKFFVNLANKNGWKNVLVVAAPCHSKRCCRDLERFGFSTTYDKHFFFCGVSLFNRKSFQWFTRSRFLYFLREIPLRLLPWPIYNFIAG